MPFIPDPLPIRRRNALLRRLHARDLLAFQAYRQDPDLARYQGWCPMSEAEAARFIDEMERAPLFQPGEWVQLGIADPDTDHLLGDIGLFLAADDASAELGFTLARGAQGRGVATAAVEASLALVLARPSVGTVFAITDARNAASIRLLSRVGMRRLESRESVFKGASCTELVYGLER